MTVSPATYQELRNESDDHGDRHACVVIATAVLAGVPLRIARDVYARHGRRPGKGVRTFKVLEVMREDFGLKVVEVTKQFEKVKTTRAFARAVRPNDGMYMVATKGHMLAVADGIVHDWSATRLCRISQVWRVYR